MNAKTETASLDWSKLSPHKFSRNDCGVDRHDAAEHVMWALNGVESIATVLQHNIDGENPGFWSEQFVWMLHQGQQALIVFARQQTQLMNHELWVAHALLGEYGEENKVRMQRELAADERA